MTQYIWTRFTRLTRAFGSFCLTYGRCNCHSRISISFLPLGLGPVSAALRRQPRRGCAPGSEQKELQLKNVFIKNHNLTLSESIQVSLLNPTRNILPRTRNQLDSSPRHSMQLNVPPPCRQQHLQPWLHCVPPSVPQAGR